MNKNSRILPQLNVCFLQKKAYDAHRKKIDYIMQSLRTSQLKKQNHRKQHSQQNLEGSRSSNKMSTIKQQTVMRYDKMRPLQKRKMEENIKQNHRLIKRIETCSATISRKDLSVHMVRSKQIKNRLCKFKLNPGSKKPELKSVHSLHLLQRGKKDLQSSGTHVHQTPEASSGKRQHKSFEIKISREDSSQFIQIPDPLRKQGSFDKLQLKRNSNKIKLHFGRDDFISRAKARLQALRESNSTEINRPSGPDLSSSFWKSRCFTTQIQNYP